MPNFSTFLNAITLATEAASATAPAVEQFASGDHEAATTQLVQIAGATAAAATSDPEIQGEATAATQLAVVLLPSIFKIFSLFHKPKAA